MYLKWNLRAAAEGFAPAQMNVGLFYESGLGVPKNDADAAVWYRKAADKGYAPAQSNLGVMDAGGRGVPRDDRAGINWYLKAAAQSYLPAEVNLGMAYLRVAQAHYIAEAMK
jgi:uncharacterized protein